MVLTWDHKFAPIKVSCSIIFGTNFNDPILLRTKIRRKIKTHPRKTENRNKQSRFKTTKSQN